MPGGSNSRASRKGAPHQRIHAVEAQYTTDKLVKIAEPYRVRTREGFKVIDSWWFVCTLDREQFDRLREDYGLPPEARRGRRDGMERVPVLCWCEHKMVLVPEAVADIGRRGSCGGGCFEGCRRVREES